MYGKPGWQRAEDDIVLCFVCFVYSYVHVCECVFIYDYFHFNIYSLTANLQVHAGHHGIWACSFAFVVPEFIAIWASTFLE